VAAAIPYAESLVVLEAAQFARVADAVRLLFRVAHGERFGAAVDAGASELARHRPGNTGVFMGYDFHLTPAGPRLIEINTNAGGALLNGLRTLAVVDPERVGCLCGDLLPLRSLEERVVATFRRELAKARGPGAALRRVAIVDDAPEAQFLYPEFLLVRDLLLRRGISAHVADTRALDRDAAGRVVLEGEPVDLVYLRDTDFLLETARTRVLREAYLSDAVVVTPAPREHHLLANKARLVLFSQPERLVALGVAAEDARHLAALVPEAVPLAELGLEAAWRERKGFVFKPEAGYGSRAVYRGDKLTRKTLEAIFAAGDYLAQRREDPGEVNVQTLDGPARMKFDVRAYAYDDEILLLGARVYRGQVTNLRTPGGGFSAICVSRK
jgi:hypothetical protein